MCKIIFELPLLGDSPIIPSNPAGDDEESGGEKTNRNEPLLTSRCFGAITNHDSFRPLTFELDSYILAGRDGQ